MLDKNQHGNKTGSNSYREGSVQHDSNVMKKKLNSLGLDRLIWLCKLCGSYTHIVADRPDSLKI